MSETPKKVSLDAALRGWPDAEKAPEEWEKMARSVVARLGPSEPGASALSAADENFLADPLGQSAEDGHNSAAPAIFTGSTAFSASQAPASPGKGVGKRAEGTPMTMPADRERDRRSLQDLAKMAQMTPPPPATSQPGLEAPSGVQRAAEAKKDDSGLVDLAAAAASDPHAVERAQATPLAAQGLFEEDPASARPPPSQSAQFQAQQPIPSMPPVPASVPPVLGAPSSSLPAVAPAVQSSAPASFAPSFAAPSAISSQLTAVPAKKKGGAAVALILGGLVAVGSMAAGTFVFMKHRAQERAAQTVAMNDKPAVAVAAPASKPAETVAAADPTPAPEATLDPNALPTPNAKVAAAAPKGFAPKSGARPAGEPAKEEATAKLSQKDIPQGASGPAGDLGDAIQKAAGPSTTNQQTPAAGSNGPQFAAGSVPQKPSQGAVTGAIGAVLSQARQCLGPDDPVSYASIVFASGGSVQSVNVTGAAAGKPVEGCIKSALMKAKVSPFAEATYTARITVRH